MTRSSAKGLGLIILALLLTAACSHTDPAKVRTHLQDKKYDLVLVHGLANKHHWGEAFLDACLGVWGSGNVYVVYLGGSTRAWQRYISGKRLICIGENDSSAGNKSIQWQALYLQQAIEVLQKEQGLGAPFDIMAHSMGGLVSRYYIQKNPGKVAALVTLGTPHHGSPLADSFQWVGLFIGADEAIADLQPERMARFNKAYPAAEAPLAQGGAMHTVRGDCPGGDCLGWGGELALGWQFLKRVYEVDNDGLVPYDSAVLDGAGHIGDFPEYDHYELVLQPDVALKAAEYLP